jgi:flagellar FliL protein
MLEASAGDKLDLPMPDLDEPSEDGEAPSKPASSSWLSPDGWIGLLVMGGIMTVIAGGLGVGLGMWTAGSIEKVIAERQAAEPLEEHKVSIKYSGDMVLHPVKPVIANLASPSDTWVRLETSMIFRNGAIDNPEVTAAEVSQDILAYIRNIKLTQLEGPSALQHLREDLNERVRLRTDNQVSELVIQTLVIQ